MWWTGERGRRRPWRRIRYLLWAVIDRLDGIEEQLTKIEQQQGEIMTQQDDLNALVTRIDTAVAGIRQDIADLKAAVEAGQPLDFTALEERVAGLEGLDAESPAPETPTE